MPKARKRITAADVLRAHNTFRGALSLLPLLTPRARVVRRGGSVYIGPWRATYLMRRASELLRLQWEFARAVGVLLVWLAQQNHEGQPVRVTLGEGYDDDFTGHMKGSLHYIKLAQDLNLFVGDKYIATDHPVWRAIGAKWKTLGAAARWGGDFRSRDYNHVSFTFGGRS